MRYGNLALCWLISPWIAGAGPAAATPREIGPAERQAVELAARYLEDGPSAWLPYLSEGSRLARLEPDTAAKELELRAGPAAGARWRLQTVPESVAADSAVFAIEFPSGVDEILQLTLVPGEPDWRILDVGFSARETTEVDTVVEFAAPSETAADAPPPSTPPASSPILPLAATGVLLLLLMMAWRRDASWPLRLALIGALVVTAGLFASRFLRANSQPPAQNASPSTEAATTDRRLAWRRAAAEGEDLDSATDESRLWQAQLLASELRLNEAEAILADLRAGSDGRSELLRARLGLLRMRPVDTVSAYERALEMLPRHDGLVLEVARASELLGFEERARRYYDELAEMESRQGETYYELARRVLIDDLWSRAAEHFETAWRLQPRRREEIIGQPVLAALVEGRTKLETLLGLSSVKEPAVRCRDRSRQPMTVPESFSASLIGSLLVLEAPGGGTLEIPGGCPLAPRRTVIFDAGSWQERRDRRLLDQTADPESRRHLAEAVEALVRQGRWQEVVRRTEGLSTELASAFPQLARNRAEALRRAGRTDAARQLLLDLATVNSEQKRVDPTTLYQLAELLVVEQQYDLALRLMAKAHAELPFDVSRQRMLQVQIEKRLATLSLEYESEHFELIYPVERSLRYAKNVARILEAERRRLHRWIPLESDTRVKVFLLDFDDWRASHSDGIEILGLFDGRIHVPFGEIAFFKPHMVSIITHELAHAMISELTRDRAPRWFQEGLAQHVEMAAGRLNPIPGYHATGSLLAFPVIETILDKSRSQEMAIIAYEEAQWTLHFIESRYGVDAIHRLLKAFGDGSTTADAIQTVLGKSIEEFDRELWTWCLESAPQIWPRKIIDYDGLPV